MTCKVRRVRTKTNVRCTVKLVNASASARTVGLRLSRHGRVVASGAGKVRGGRASVRMTAGRRAVRGRRYDVTVVARRTGGRELTSKLALRLR